MKRSILFDCCLFLLFFPISFFQSITLVSAAERPNILFIYTDDQSHRTVGCYPDSHDWAKTPNIDKLAASGMRFDSAYIGTWCMPSRASLLTGRQPHAIESMRMVGTYPGSTYDPKQCPFWPKVFRENGYITAQIGKWHTGSDTGMNRDWDYQIVWNRPNLANDKIKTYPAAYYYDQMITYPDGSQKVLEEYSTDVYTKWAEEFIRGEKGRSAESGKPWYLWLCYGAIHSPFTPADRHKKAYAKAGVQPPQDIYPPKAGKPDWLANFSNWEKGPDGEPVMVNDESKTLQAAVAKYNEGVLALDEGVAKLIQTLKETDQLENTLIVFTSDQGFAWGQHGLNAKKAPYDATIRGPLIISWPKLIKSGQVCNVPVSGVDLVSTFFAQAGIEIPWKMHGHDLTPLLKNPKEEWSNPVIISFQNDVFGSDTKELPTPETRPDQVPWYVSIFKPILDYTFGADMNVAETRPGQVPWYVSIRKGDYKYIRYLIKDELDELYHLKNDPDELQNEIFNPEYREIVSELRAELQNELIRTEAPFADSMPQTRSEKKLVHKKEFAQ